MPLLDDLDDYNFVVDQFYSKALTEGASVTRDIQSVLRLNSGLRSESISARVIFGPSLTPYRRGELFLDMVPGSPSYRNFVVAQADSPAPALLYPLTTLRLVCDPILSLDLVDQGNASGGSGGSGGGGISVEVDPTVVRPLNAMNGVNLGLIKGTATTQTVVSNQDLGVALTFNTVEAGKLSVSTMVGATSSTPGIRGLPVAPNAGQQTAFLRGDNTWASTDLPIVSLSGASVLQANTNYPADTSAAGFAVTLPTAPANGSQVVVRDVSGSFAVNPLVVNRGGSDTIEGLTTATINTANQIVSFQYNSANGRWTAAYGKSTASSAPTTANIPNAPASTVAPVAISNKPTGGAIGTAGTTVDVNSHFTVTQTTVGQTLSLPNPSSTPGSRLVIVENSSTSTAGFTLYGDLVAIGGKRTVTWNGSSWGIVGAPATVAPSIFTGATASVNGSVGLVPAPAAGQQASFLRGDGTWAGNVPTAVNISATQISHGFVVGTPVGRNSAGTAWTKSTAASGSTLALGLVDTVIDPNTFTILPSGPLTLTSVQWDAITESAADRGPGSTGLQPFQYYYLSGAVAGAITVTEPSGYSQPVLMATSQTQAVVLEYRPLTKGVVNGSVSVGGSTTVPQVHQFNNSAIYTVTPGTTYAIVEVVGGGGAGGSTNSTNVNELQVGSGGSSGSYVKAVLTASQLGSGPIVVTVGVGGAPTSMAGGPGGASSVGSLVSAPGGNGGLTSATINAGKLLVVQGAAGPTPPAPSVGTKLSASSGGNGQPGQGFLSIDPNTLFGANDSLTLTGGGGGNSNPANGGGQPLLFGPSLPTNYATNGNSGVAGTGGGGSGSASANGGGIASGGNGGSGYVQITEY